MLIIKIALILSIIVIAKAQFHYKKLNDYTRLPISEDCIKTESRIRCSIYKLNTASIESHCLNSNVLRIVGEFDIVRIVCSSPHALNFRYHGIQPTEAIHIEWYKEVLPLSSANISSFGVDISIYSIDALHRFYSNKIRKNLTRIDYPRTGNFIFSGIYEPIVANFFIYFEDNGVVQFLRNLQTQPKIIDNFLHLPCIPSKHGYETEIYLNRENEAVETVEFDKSNTEYQGLKINITNERPGHGTYNCIIKSNSEVVDNFTIHFTSTESNLRYGLEKVLPNDYGQNIKYYSKELSDRNIKITIACKVHKLGVHTYLAAIEAENYGMMNLKREFPFPKFINRSYTAEYINTVGELTFEIKLNNTFNTRYGGASFCLSGDQMDVEEFAVPFEGDVSKRIFDTDWTKFNREKSNIRIHYELNILREGEKEDEEIYADTELTFECKFIIAIVVKPAIWYSVWRNGSRIEEMVDYNWTGKLGDTSYFRRKAHIDMVRVDCSASFYYASFWRYISVPLNISAGSAPVIENPTNDLVLRVGTLNQGVFCKATGKPTPKISWFKGGLQLHAFLSTNGTLLHQIPRVEWNHEGDYICVAENVYGKVDKVFKYKVEGESTNHGVVIGIPLAVFVLTLMGASIYVKFFRKEKTGLTRAEIEEFISGEKNAIRNSSAYAHEFAHLCAYDKSFELSDNKFQIDTTDILGSGAYGIVLRGIVEGKPAAVKTTKKNADKAYLKALLSELKIMIYLGFHENIIQLIGASTKDLDKGSVYIFVPFCGNGNLERYLRTNRHAYEETEPTEYRNVDAGVFNFNDLLLWSIQIADGMEFLATKKVIHGDLAARNILLTDGKLAKITDFGLSRQLYGYASYVKKHQEPLPWRWMALESLRDLSFSTLSDIWSYGILLWEIFTLGEVPYPGMAWTLDFVDELENGLRMSRPRRTPESIYNTIIYLCWHKIPAQRPSFMIIQETLQDYRNQFKLKKDVENIHEKPKTEFQLGKANEYTNL